MDRHPLSFRNRDQDEGRAGKKGEKAGGNRGSRPCRSGLGLDTAHYREIARLLSELMCVPIQPGPGRQALRQAERL